MTFRTRKLQILSFGGNVDQFHLVPSKMLVEVRVCTRRKLAFYQKFSMPICGAPRYTNIHTYWGTVSIKRNILYKAFFDLFNTAENQVLPTY